MHTVGLPKGNQICRSLENYTFKNRTIFQVASLFRFLQFHHKNNNSVSSLHLLALHLSFIDFPMADVYLVSVSHVGLL